MVKSVTLGIGRLGLKLTVAFVGVALTAIVVASLLTTISSDRDINVLARQQEDALIDAATVASGALYTHRGWGQADVGPVLDLVAREGAAAQVRDLHGKVIGSTPGYSRFGADRQLASPVIAEGRPVGTMVMKFGNQGVDALAVSYESKRLRAMIEAAGIVAAIAFVVSFVISRQITLPAERVIRSLRARSAGDRSVRISDVGGTGVIHEISVALNDASDAIDNRDRLQRNLVANVAHELRTPVAILQASYEAILDGVTPPTAENLWSLRDEVLRLARMIDDLQRLAAAEAAALQLKLVPCDLSAVAATGAASLSDSFGAAGVSLDRQLSTTWSVCDPDRMREVIVNLLTNALKFTPAGGRVMVRTDRNGQGLARLTVSDTGIGIPSNELPRVTERFFRGQHSAEMATGSGIGLAIVAELVHAQHGDLNISSELGQGTQATITIPGTKAAGPQLRRQRWGRTGLVRASGATNRADRASRSDQTAAAGREDQAASSSDRADLIGAAPGTPRGAASSGWRWA